MIRSFGRGSSYDVEYEVRRCESDHLEAIHSNRHHFKMEKNGTVHQNAEDTRGGEG